MYCLYFVDLCEKDGSVNWWSWQEVHWKKELNQLLEMEFGNVLSYMKLPQERRESKGIEDLEVSSTVRSRKLTLSSRCLQWPRTKEMSEISASHVRAYEIEMNTRLLHNVSWSQFQQFHYEQKKCKMLKNASDKILTSVF